MFVVLLLVLGLWFAAACTTVLTCIVSVDCGKLAMFLSWARGFIALTHVFYNPHGHKQGSMLGATLSRVRGGLMSKASIRSATVPVSMAGGRAMSVWSEMPMGPPDPILGLTGTICVCVMSTTTYINMLSFTWSCWKRQCVLCALSRRNSAYRAQ